jgi:serine/threonine-protein kinase
MKRCPRPDELRGLLADDLSGPEAEALEAHLEGCSRCQQELERWTAAATHPDTGPEDRLGADRDFLRRLQQQPPIPTPPAPQPDQAETRPEAPAGPITVAPATGRGLPSVQELQALLRKRLLFVASLTWGVVVVYAVYAAVFVPVFPDVLTPSLFSLMVGTAGILTLILWRGRRLSLPQLRWLEVILFASMGLYFTWMQFFFHSFGWLARLAPYDWQGVWLMARALSFGWCALIVLYGILIPNTWRRCAAVVGVMALWAVLAGLAGGSWEAIGEGRLHWLFVLEMATDVAMAVCLAIYGAHRIETLRAQASQARKLGPYQLKRRLGAGGMGEVYLAEHVLLRRPCALKIIRPERAGDAQFLRRFEREVQAMATLSHPNTVEVFDYGHADDGTFYYAMEYLPGLTLEQLVERHGPLPAERVVHLLRQVCGALQEAHGIGLVHRDVKPSNVLVCERGGLPDVAKLLDFGLVRAPGSGVETSQLTQEGMIAGTPAYMSPEQADSQPVLDGRSDLYSLGAVAYFLLTGRPPFQHATAVRTLAAHLSEPVTAPQRLRADVPPDLQEVVLRCLEKKPARRFPDAEALEHALARCACAGGWTRERSAGWWQQHGGKKASGLDSHCRSAM